MDAKSLSWHLMGSLSRRPRTTVFHGSKIIHSGPARTAIGFQFVLPLIVLNQLGLTAISETEINRIATLLKQIIQQNDINVPVVNNPAKRMAGQFLNRWVTLFGAGSMAFVAERWKSQMNENAKAWAQVEKIPDLCFSTMGGLNNPGSLLSQMMTFFLDSPVDHPTNQMISEEARRMFMVEGFNTDRYLAPGDTELECLWSAILFGDFVSYYLAMAYEVDPTPVPGVEEMQDLLNHMD